MKKIGLRILVVDDKEDWRDSIKLIFDGRHDIAIAEAFSARDAINKLKVEDYDLVLLDMKMPTHEEGLDALLEIKELKPKTSVIMMSAYGDISKAVEAMKRGALDFLPKGPEFKDLIRYKINEFIRVAHLIDDRELLIHTKYKEVKEAKNSHEKGKALEDVTGAILASIEGFIETERNINTATEEIDIVIRNESRHPFWEKQGSIILVECKNWGFQRVGKNEFVAFKEKVENRHGRCKIGFLVCTGAFAETVHLEMLSLRKDDIVIVPIDGDNLSELIEANNRSLILIKFVEKALLI